MGHRHDEVAREIARKDGVAYNSGKGVDVVSSRRAVEVKTVNTVRDGIRQLQGHRKPSYIAGTSDRAVRAALEATRGTTLGVMDPKGKVVKLSTRGKPSPTR